jgi:5-methylcytosine-specific restriction endonuclease McrA
MSMKFDHRLLRSNRQRYQIWKSQSGRCAICKKPMGDDFEIDHRKPVKKGGVTAYHNLQAVHPLCNRKKGAS